MSEEDQELLWRRVFGDLTPEENADLERRLRKEPQLASALAEYYAEYSAEYSACQQDLAKEDAANERAPQKPERLVDRTLDAVRGAECGGRVDATGGRGTYTLAELISVAVAACLLGALILPAINYSREQARRIACSNNLRTLGQSLVAYADDRGGQFPELAPRMNAGIFSVRLADARHLDRHTASQTLLCPSSDLAGRVAERRASVYVPRAWELRAADGLVLDRLRRLMAGSYAYRLGYFSGGVFVSPRNEGDSRQPLLADAQRRGPDGEVISRNHGDCGQNVLFQDGHVSFQRDCWSPCLSNHLYLNDNGVVAAGAHRNDVVLGDSAATPGFLPVRTVTFDH